MPTLLGYGHLKVVVSERETYIFAAGCRKEAREEAGAELQGRAGVAVVTSDDGVVLGLEDELQDVAILCRDG